MAENRGKKFEGVIRLAFECVPNVSVTRLPDPTNGYLGIRNISDFIIYHFPHQYFIECKSVHGNTLPFSNITDNQWKGMLEVSKSKGVIAGVICWWVDKDTTMFIDIRLLNELKSLGYKSIDYCASFALEHIDNIEDMWFWVVGKKKRVFFDYDMTAFFKHFE